ncbi:hypothetical protein FB451DRAFT_1187548 [Mycena latifolia]|nr:hypothetical protein FB451DRAFT_1187548 [Mycena latifolia]
MEDILNARVEVIYFRRGANFIDEEPSFLFLPTSFINDCRTLLALPNTPFSPEVIRLWEHIRSGKVTMLGFLVWTDNNYSVIFKLSMANLDHGNSLHLPAAPDTLRILRWAFSGLSGFMPLPDQTHIPLGLIDRQHVLAGGGSCGIAAMNFVESRIG